MKEHKNVAVTAIIAAMGVSSFAFADMMQNSMPVSQQVNNSNMAADQKISVVASRVDQITTKNVNGTMGGKLPSYLYNSGFNLDVDFIYWRTDEEGLAYATLVNPSVAPTATSPGLVSLTQKKIEAGWDPGFRLQLGYTFHNVDQWDLEFDWTYFHNRERNSATISSLSAATALTADSGYGQEYMQPTWVTPDAPLFCSSATSKWTLNYNTLDMELGRNFFIGKSLSIRPHWGLRAAWLYQHLTANYTGFYDSGLGAIAGGEAGLSAHNNFHGVGLRTGASMRWSFTRSWAVVGEVAAALIYGRFQVSQTNSSNLGAGASAGLANVVSSTYNFNAVRPQVEAALGFEWCAFFYHDEYRFAIDALWEVQAWFEQNQFQRMVQYNTAGANDGVVAGAPWAAISDRVNANLGIQGFTLKFRLDF